MVVENWEKLMAEEKQEFRSEVEDWEDLKRLRSSNRRYISSFNISIGSYE